MKDTGSQVDEDLDPTTIATESEALEFFTDAFNRAATDTLGQGGTEHDLQVECLRIWEAAVAANPKLPKLLKVAKRDKLIRERCAKLAQLLAEMAPPTGDPDNRPWLRSDTTEIGSAIDSIERLLAETPSQVFAFGGQTVSIQTGPVTGLWQDEAKTRPNVVSSPQVLNSQRARRLIDRRARWRRAGRKGLVPTPTPEWAADQLAKGGVSKYYPPLRGILRHPAIAPGNKLVAGQSGYDPATQFFIDAPAPAEIDYQWASAKEALDYLLNDWLGEFQFASQSDQHRALLYPLTMLKARLTISASLGQKWPAFFATAPVASSGKTELIVIATLAITGELPPFAVFHHDNEQEMAKSLLAIARNDPATFCYDNVSNGKPIASAELDKAITFPTYEGRLLGVSETVKAPSLAVITATGNNIEVTGDAATRWLEVRLVPKETNPHRHIFGRRIREYTDANRGRIISALVRVGAVEHNLPTGARFPVWHDEVAGPVIELTGDKSILDAWDKPAVGLDGGNSLGAFLARLSAMKEARVKVAAPGAFTGFYVSEIVADSEALEAASSFASGITGEILTAAESFDPESLSSENLKVALRAQKAARVKASQILGRTLMKRRDQAAFGYRLIVNDGVGADSHPCKLYDVKALFSPQG